MLKGVFFCFLLEPIRFLSFSLFLLNKRKLFILYFHSKVTEGFLKKLCKNPRITLAFVGLQKSVRQRCSF